MSMSEIPIPNATTAVKLASLAVHAGEATSPDGAPEDLIAIKAAVQDPDVKAFLEAMPDALLPLKRSSS